MVKLLTEKQHSSNQTCLRLGLTLKLKQGLAELPTLFSLRFHPHGCESSIFSSAKSLHLRELTLNFEGSF